MHDGAVEKEAKYFAYGLIFLISWTVGLKYMAPILWAIKQKTNLAHWIVWDAWPLAHLAVVYLFLKGRKAGWLFALAVAVAELFIIFWKLRVYFISPNPDFWRVQWAINKTVLLAYFLLMLFWLLKPYVRRSFVESR